MIRQMISSLRQQVVEKLPAKGVFPVIYEREENLNKNIALSHLILKVTAVPVKGSEDKRYLEIAVVNYPRPYGSERVLCLGYTQDIINALNDEESLLQRILKVVPEMARNLEYI